MFTVNGFTMRFDSEQIKLKRAMLEFKRENHILKGNSKKIYTMIKLWTR